MEALARVLTQAKIKLAHEVTVDRLSVSDRINQIADRLESEGSFSFRSCFWFLMEDKEVTMGEARHEVVVTFLALLEMARLNLIRLSQPPVDEEDPANPPDIYISRASDNLLERVADTVVQDEEYR